MLKSTLPWVSALVLFIDFWKIKLGPSMTKAASSPAENAAYVSKPKQFTEIGDLFHKINVSLM